MKHEVTQLDRATWEREAALFADYNYRQGWAFGLAAAAHVGAVSEHVACVTDGVLRGLADVRVKGLPVVGGGVAYVNGGPLVRRVNEPSTVHLDRLRGVTQMLHAEYVKDRGMVLRIVGTIGDARWSAAQDEVLEAAGFVPSTMATTYRTMIRRVDEPMSVIRSGLAQKWRNCLNKAERQGVTVTAHRDTGSMQRFVLLYDEFVARKGVHANHDAAYFMKVQQDACSASCGSEEPLTVRLAERDGELLAGHVSSSLGDTCVYLLGATSPAGLRCNAAYLLQWDTICAAHNAGRVWYDLGGIDPQANPGVHHFKEGVRGIDVTAVGPYEACSKSVLGLVSSSSEKLYRSWRDRRKSVRIEGAKGDAPRSECDGTVKSQ